MGKQLSRVMHVTMILYTSLIIRLHYFSDHKFPFPIFVFLLLHQKSFKLYERIMNQL